MIITVDDLINKIESKQAVNNKNMLSASDINKTITNVAELDKAKLSSVSFIVKDTLIPQLINSSAGVVIIKKSYLDSTSQQSIPLIVDNPYLAYASVSQLFDIQTTAGIHPTAIIDTTAILHDTVNVGAYTVIGAGVCIDSNTQIASNTSIADDTIIGCDTVIESNVTIGKASHIGNHVRIHAGATIASEGFGFASIIDPAQKEWERIAQLGRVVIGNYVRVGANTTIDRGAIEDTIIGDHVIIDNLVQIAHNVQIGSGTAIAAKTGIAGSTKIGKNCSIAGAVGIIGHIEICDDVTITGMSLITKSIIKAGSYSSGMPAISSPTWRRAVVRLRQLAKK